MFNSDVKIVSLDGMTVYATMFKPIINLSSLMSNINLTYTCNVIKPDIIDPWAVSSIAYLIIVHLREAINEKNKK